MALSARILTLLNLSVSLSRLHGVSGMAGVLSGLEGASRHLLTGEETGVEEGEEEEVEGEGLLGGVVVNLSLSVVKRTEGKGQGFHVTLSFHQILIA